jgi:hypothetical protein
MRKENKMLPAMSALEKQGFEGFFTKTFLPVMAASA